MLCLLKGRYFTREEMGTLQPEIYKKGQTMNVETVSAMMALAIVLLGFSVMVGGPKGADHYTKLVVGLLKYIMGSLLQILGQILSALGQELRRLGDWINGRGVLRYIMGGFFQILGQILSALGQELQRAGKRIARRRRARQKR